jgi:hypothetical protein
MGCPSLFVVVLAAVVAYGLGAKQVDSSGSRRGGDVAHSSVLHRFSSDGCWIQLWQPAYVLSYFQYYTPPEDVSTVFQCIPLAALRA